MNLIEIAPRKALNKAFLKVKPSRNDIETFKTKLISLTDKINEDETEEFHKNLVSQFLRETWYGDKYFINTKGRNDLVIHTGKDAHSPVGVIIEAKKPANASEMLRKNRINTKAFQELVLYYMRERIAANNLEIKYLIATNIYEWFIFDVSVFEKAFARNSKFVKQFNDFEAGRLAGANTDFFYKQVAEPEIDAVENDIIFTHFDIRDYEKPLRNNDRQDDNKLIALYKLFSPEHLLKLPFANDSNSLDKTFYSELLHIIGLTETKNGGKKLIERKRDGERDSGSLLENAINQLDSLDKISRLTNPRQFGENQQERLFNAALELVITWINRILFLKLLEAQLIKYHKGDENFAFLNSGKVPDYDALNSLFFQALAKKIEDRNAAAKALFANVPYLNSSLFEPTELEHNCLFISQLSNEKISVLAASVLKDERGRKKSGSLDTLEYLFEFLNAYDFSSEGSEDIQEDNKTLINASVLGLIFEKINGYKDGSFFTPGFITMYMCRETIRRAVVQKFNAAKGWNCENIDRIFDKITDKPEANAIINSLKICDPAVGSGHFLVSALNEIIAVKSELKILLDRQGKNLRDYQFEVVNDELIVTDDDGRLFEYNPNNKESQRVQETLFHEKQTIIENCLFGVDINPNSVKICRLRLWIELLKNAYYKADSNGAELETLPNIDINIKCGNSLISRYALDTDIKKALKKSKFSIQSYRTAVMAYRNAQNKEEKRAMEKLIERVKNDFETEINHTDKRSIKLEKLKNELNTLINQPDFFGISAAAKKEKLKKVNSYTDDIQKLETEINEIKNNKIYENAFEWRFEFPEVLNDDGDFIGFDVIIGNPPYGVVLSQQESLIINQQLLSWQNSLGNDSYFYFIARGLSFLSSGGSFAYIVPNTWRLIVTGVSFRKIILTCLNNVDTHVKPVFSEAVVDCDIIFASQKAEDKVILSLRNGEEYIKTDLVPRKILLQQEIINTHLGMSEYSLIEKIKRHSRPLCDYFTVKNGVKPYERGKGVPPQTQDVVNNKPFTSECKENDTFKPLIGGSLFNRYVNFWNNNYWISYGPWLAAPRDANIFDAPEKIIIRQTSDRLIGTIIKSGFILRNNTHIVLPLNDDFNLYCVLGILNSKLIDFIYWTMNPEKGEALAEVKKFHVENLPIPNISECNQQPIANLADQILAAKKENPTADTTALEREIDQLVYKLYGLTAEEIAIVEGKQGKL